MKGVPKRRQSSCALNTWRECPTLSQINCSSTWRILHPRKHRFFPHLCETVYCRGSQLVHCPGQPGHSPRPSLCLPGWGTGPAPAAANGSIFVMTLHSPTLWIMASQGKGKEGEKVKRSSPPQKNNYIFYNKPSINQNFYIANVVSPCF